MVIQVNIKEDELPRKLDSSLDPRKNRYLEKSEQRDLARDGFLDYVKSQGICDGVRHRHKYLL